MEQIHNKELYINLQVLTESALSFYGRNLKLDPQRMSEKYYVIRLLINFDNEIKKIPEFSECEEIMKVAPEINGLLGNLVGTCRGFTTTGNSESCLLSFLRSFYFKNAEFSLDIFNQAYLSFEELFYSEKLQFIDSTALYNFQYEEAEIDLSDGIVIKTKVVSLSEPDYDFEGGYANFSKSSYIIQRKYETAKIIKSGVPSEPEEPLAIPGEDELNISSDIFDRVISALRILKSSGVYRDHRINSEMETFHPHGGITTIGSWFENIVIGEKCVLVKSEIEELSDIYQFITKEKDTRFNIAMRRLSLGMERRNIEDKLIDYMIGLESLYLPNGNDELTFRLSMRVAFLLGDQDHRKEIFDFIKKMYATRSKIVHGNKHGLTNDDIIKIEGFLRDSIKFWIKDDASFSEDNLNDIFFKI